MLKFVTVLAFIVMAFGFGRGTVASPPEEPVRVYLPSRIVPKPTPIYLRVKDKAYYGQQRDLLAAAIPATALKPLIRRAKYP